MQPASIGGRPLGPWLRAAPDTRHDTIFVGAQGNVSVYPPATAPPPAYDSSHDFDAADPCTAFAWY
jgi:hypothetical protein